MPLKARQVPIDEQIRNTVGISSHTNDDTWVKEVISKNFKKTQKVRCFNYGKPGHLKRDCSQGIARNNVFLQK